MNLKKFKMSEGEMDGIRCVRDHMPIGGKRVVAESMMGWKPMFQVCVRGRHEKNSIMHRNITLFRPHL